MSPGAESRQRTRSLGPRSGARTDTAILLFAKAPLPGTVKTRLANCLGAERAALLHRRLTRHALETAIDANLGPVILYCAPDTRDPFFRGLKQETGVLLRTQRGPDLGARMNHALRWALRQHRAAMVIGADCPEMDSAYLRQAADALTSKKVTAVLGPAVDGGYVLIGATRLEARLFADVPWGSSEVLEITRERLRALGWRFTELRALRDVDRPEDLARLDRELLD